MTEETTTNTELAFAELLEAYEPRSVQPGDYCPGEILRIDKEYAIIDIGAKQEAVVPIQELDKVQVDFTETLVVGDQVPVCVESVPGMGERLVVSILKGLERADWENSEKLLESQEILELEVIGYNQGGLLVKFHRLTGFIPNSHVPELRRTKDDQDLKVKTIGQTIPVQVLQVDPTRKRLVFTARAAAQVRRADCLNALQVGQTIEGTVKNLVPFGAFVDLGGIDGLIHISELDWKHVTHPSEILQTGENVHVVVREIDVARERISLSRKALLPSPWQQFAIVHAVEDLVEGVITNIQDYGAFVQLNDEIVGLLHVSEVDTTGGGSPNEMFRKGDKILTRIIEMEPGEERIRLSTRRVTYQELAVWATQDWENEQDVGDDSEFPSGEVVPHDTLPEESDWPEPEKENPLRAEVADMGAERIPS